MASEKIKWYHPLSLEPIILVPNVSKAGMHECTLKDCRRQGGPAYGALESVTSVLKLIHSFGLEDWKTVQIMLACKDIPFDPEYTEESWFRVVKQKADAYAEMARTKGEEIHWDVQLGFGGKKCKTEVGENVYCNIFDWIVGRGIAPDDITCEEPLGSKILGYAGTPDLSDKKRLVLDLKTTDLIKFRSPYETWMLQLGAYSLALGGGREIWQVVADRNTGKCEFIQYEDTGKWENAWQSLLELWFAIKNYDPRRC